MKRISTKIITRKRGIATVVALVALAVVGSAVTLFMQTILRERHQDAHTIRILQADCLAQDMMAMSETKKQKIELTVPKSALDGIADLRMESDYRDINGKPDVTVKATFVPEETPHDMNPTFIRRNQHAKQSHEKRQP